MSTAVDKAAEHLRHRILSGKLPAGSRLPPERELATELGINRLTLRSALARLAASNLVSVRQGSGYLVRPWRREGGPELLDGLLALNVPSSQLGSVVPELLRVRRHLAVAVLERLCDGVALPARRRIEAAVHHYIAQAEQGVDPDTAASLDLAVLEAILDATDSPVYALCLNPISRVLADMPALRRAMYTDALGGARSYGLLLEWLAAPTPHALPLLTEALAARDAMTIEHLHADLDRAAKPRSAARAGAPRAPKTRTSPRLPPTRRKSS